MQTARETLTSLGSPQKLRKEGRNITEYIVAFSSPSPSRESAVAPMSSSLALRSVLNSVGSVRTINLTATELSPLLSVGFYLSRQSCLAGLKVACFPTFRCQQVLRLSLSSSFTMSKFMDELAAIPNNETKFLYTVSSSNKQNETVTASTKILHSLKP